MANRFFTGNVDDAWNNAANWSAVSGGGGGAGVPALIDDVFLDAATPALCTVDLAIGLCLTFDCTGFTGTFDLNGNTLQVDGVTFLLVAAMTFTPGTGAVEFTALAGVPAITSVGKSLYDIHINGAGATFTLQDNLTVTNDFDHDAGAFACNGNDLSVGQDVDWAAGLLVGDFIAGAGTITISRNLTANRKDVLVANTSHFIFDGAGTILFNGVDFDQTFYRLTVGPPGLTTGYRGTNIATLLNVTFRLTVGTGTFDASLDAGVVEINSNQLDALVNGGTIQGDLLWVTSIVGTHLLTGGIYGGLQLSHNGNTGDLIWQAQGAITINGDLDLTELQTPLAAASRVFDVNGQTIFVSGAFDSGTDAVLGRGFNVDGGTGSFTVGGAWAVNFPTGTVIDIFTLTTGNIDIGGAIAWPNTALEQSCTLGTGRLSSGGSWDSSVMAFGPFFEVTDEEGTVRFTAGPGIITIVADANEFWPKVEFTGGCTVTLPNGWSSSDLVITAGLITAGNPFTVRGSLNNGGTFTYNNDIYVWDGILNTGTIITGAGDVYSGGAFVRFSGIAIVTFRMEPTTYRVQFESTMAITTLIIEDRYTPGVIRFQAGGVFTIGTLNSQIARAEGSTQLISSTRGTAYSFNVGVGTSHAYLWPSDNDASGGVAFVGDASNKDFGGNTNWTLNSNGVIVVYGDDIGLDPLATGGLGITRYCWFVGASLANLTAIVANFTAGLDPWHRITDIPFSRLDNLNVGVTYFVALGMIDERGRRLSPNVGGGDYVTGIAESLLGGGGQRISVDPASITMG